MSCCGGVVECAIHLRIWAKIQHELQMCPSGVTPSNGALIDMFSRRVSVTASFKRAKL